MATFLKHPGVAADAKDQRAATWKEQEGGRISVRIYQGKRTEFGCEVTVNGKPLRLRPDLSGADTTSFGWGGGGGQQLSLAMLADFIGDDHQALRLHHEFREKVIDQLPHDSWKLTETELADALASLGWRQPHRSFGMVTPGGSVCEDEGCQVSTPDEERESVRWPERSVFSRDPEQGSFHGITVEADPEDNERDSFDLKTAELSFESVAKRAYEIWERKGRGNGHALDDWLEAETQLVTSKSSL